METQACSTSTFRSLLATVDPAWGSRTEEERENWVSFYARTARSIAREYERSFKDPCHDAADVMQEIRLKILTKFRPADAPHRLLTEAPCVRKLMQWRGLDLVDWENAEKRCVKRRVPLPTDGDPLPDRQSLLPEENAEVSDSERAFRRALADPGDRRAYQMFRSGRSVRDVARRLRRPVADVEALQDRLSTHLAEWLKR